MAWRRAPISHGIVEGEPGIFPPGWAHPVRSLTSWLRSRHPAPTPDTEPTPRESDGDDDGQDLNP